MKWLGLYFCSQLRVYKLQPPGLPQVDVNCSYLVDTLCLPTEGEAEAHNTMNRPYGHLT